MTNGACVRHRPLLGELLSFGVVGAFNTLIGFLAIVVLTEGAGWSPVIANMSGFAIGLVVSFSLNKRFTYGRRRAAAGAPFRFIAAFAVAYGLNLAVLILATDLFALNPLIGQTLGVGVYALVFFLLCRSFVFRPRFLQYPSVAGSSMHE